MQFLSCHEQEVLLFPAMKPDDPNKPKEDVPESAVEWPFRLEIWTFLCPVQIHGWFIQEMHQPSYDVYFFLSSDLTSGPQDVRSLSL